MFSVEAKVGQRSANPVADRRIGRSSRPAVTPARVLEPQIAAIHEMQHSLVEGRVHEVLSGLLFGELRMGHDITIDVSLLCRIEHLHRGFWIAGTSDIE